MEPWFVLRVDGQINRDYESDNLLEVESWGDALREAGHVIEIVREVY